MKKNDSKYYVRVSISYTESTKHGHRFNYKDYKIENAIVEVRGRTAFIWREIQDLKTTKLYLPIIKRINAKTFQMKGTAVTERTFNNNLNTRLEQINPNRTFTENNIMVMAINLEKKELKKKKKAMIEFESMLLKYSKYNDCQINPILDFVIEKTNDAELVKMLKFYNNLKRNTKRRHQCEYIIKYLAENYFYLKADILKVMLQYLAIGIESLTKYEIITGYEIDFDFKNLSPDKIEFEKKLNKYFNRLDCCIYYIASDIFNKFDDSIIKGILKEHNDLMQVMWMGNRQKINNQKAIRKRLKQHIIDMYINHKEEIAEIIKHTIVGAIQNQIDCGINLKIEAEKEITKSLLIA